MTTILIQYNGTGPGSELAVTGRQNTWQPGRIEDTDYATAALLLASGLGWANGGSAPATSSGVIFVSAAQIASPTAAMLANLGATYQLNVPPGSRYQSTGTALASAGGGGATGGGSVTSTSVTTANGVSGTVATATTTPAITLTLGAITPTSVAATGTVTGSNLSGTSSGTNTGNETPSSTTPAALGTATAGSLTTLSRGDHVHAMPTAANVGALALTGGTMSGALNAASTVTIPSAASVAIGAAAANTVTISGSTAITSFDTIAVGAERRVVFSGVLTLTHNATSLILVSAANITTAANDSAHFISLGAGNWQCLSYAKANGTALTGSVITPGMVNVNTTDILASGPVTAAMFDGVVRRINSSSVVAVTVPTVSALGFSATPGQLRFMLFEVFGGGIPTFGGATVNTSINGTAGTATALPLGGAPQTGMFLSLTQQGVGSDTWTLQ